LWTRGFARLVAPTRTANRDVARWRADSKGTVDWDAFSTFEHANTTDGGAGFQEFTDKSKNLAAADTRHSPCASYNPGNYCFTHSRLCLPCPRPAPPAAVCAAFSPNAANPNANPNSAVGQRRGAAP